MELMQQAEPVGDLTPARKRLEMDQLLRQIGEFEDELRQIAEGRSQALSQSHRRVRAIAKQGQIRVKPQLPMDILGIYILQPEQRRTN